MEITKLSDGSTVYGVNDHMKLILHDPVPMDARPIWLKGQQVERPVMRIGDWILVAALFWAAVAAVVFFPW